MLLRLLLPLALAATATLMGSSAPARANSLRANVEENLAADDSPPGNPICPGGAADMVAVSTSPNVMALNLGMTDAFKLDDSIYAIEYTPSGGGLEVLGNSANGNAFLRLMHMQSWTVIKNEVFNTGGVPSASDVMVTKRGGMAFTTNSVALRHSLAPGSTYAFAVGPVGNRDTPRSAKLSEDHRYLAVVSTPSGGAAAVRIALFDTTTNLLTEDHLFPGEMYNAPDGLAFSPDSKELFMVTYNSAPSGSGQVRVFSVPTLVVKKVISESANLRSLAINPAGTKLVVVGSGFLKVYNAKAPYGVLKTIDVGSLHASSVAWSADSSLFAVGLGYTFTLYRGTDYARAYWHSSTFTNLRTVKFNPAKPKELAVVADGKLLVFGCL